MKTVSEITTSSFREKGSKFIGYLFPVASVEDFEEKLDEIKSKYPDATHHCYGWRINPNNIQEFAQDDGEPGGSAGLPILNTIKSFDAVNCACIVVRYYGGTKLGKSGLIQAYGLATEHCLEKAKLRRLIPTKNFLITYPYHQQNVIDQLKNSFDLKELNAQYLEEISLKLACRTEQADDFIAALENFEHRGISWEMKEDGYIMLD